jgi:Putative MetA-pathway of phenol degradation
VIRPATTRASSHCSRVMAVVPALTWLVVLISCGPGWAGRPLDTEDTETLDPGQAEVELSLSLAEHSGDLAWAGLAVLKVGVVPRLELGVELGGAYLQLENDRDQAGVGDLVVPLKLRLLNETEWRPALLANLRVRLPTGDAGRGLGTEGVDVVARLAVSKTIGRLTVTANGGYAFVTADRALDVWLVSGAGEYRLVPGWTVVAEVVSFLGARAASDIAIARAGIVYTVRQSLRLDIAIGTGLTRSSPDLLATAGIAIGF